MFTGLVEEVGTVRAIKRGARSCVLTIGCHEVLSDTKIGDSIMTSGVCLTVVDKTADTFSADVMSETLARSALGALKVGSRVNLERAMPANGRFGGHIVAGHIDDTGTITDVRVDDNAVWYTVALSAAALRYVVEKGSIAMDGISLTVAAVDNTSFKVSVIPHTRDVTALSDKGVGSPVNIECDIMGKYIEKLMQPAPEESTSSAITREFLAENGF